MSRSWLRHAERGSPAALRIILWIALNLGRPVARIFLYPISFYFLLTAGPQRRASKQYFRQLRGHEPSWKDVFFHIHCFASTILDRVFFLSNRFQSFDIRLSNADILLDLVNEGKGCILLGAHIGSFEVLWTLAADKKLPLKILMYPDHNVSLMQVLFELNPKVRDCIIPLGGEVFSLLKVNESLSKGGLIGMLGDRIAENDKVVRCPFLGKEADFPTGPYLLASVTGVPLIFFVCLYRGGKRYDIHFELLSKKLELKGEDRDKEIQQWCRKYVERLEHYVHIAPSNWFNFYEFWDEI